MDIIQEITTRVDSSCGGVYEPDVAPCNIGYNACWSRTSCNGKIVIGCDGKCNIRIG